MKLSFKKLPCEKKMNKIVFLKGAGNMMYLPHPFDVVHISISWIYGTCLTSPIMIESFCVTLIMIPIAPIQMTYVY